VAVAVPPTKFRVENTGDVNTILLTEMNKVLAYYPARAPIDAWVQLGAGLAEVKKAINELADRTKASSSSSVSLIRSSADCLMTAECLMFVCCMIST
jgi:hypothetical protein